MFKFSEVERRHLIECWKRPSDRTKAEKFVSGCESAMDRFAFYCREKKSVPQREKELGKIRANAERLSKALKTTSKESLGWLDAALLGHDEIKKTCPRAREKLENLLGHVVAAIDELEGAGKEAYRTRGPNNDGPLLVVAELAALHLECFGRLPSKNKWTPFHLFLEYLAPIADGHFEEDDKKPSFCFNEETIKAAFKNILITKGNSFIELQYKNHRNYK